MSSNMTAKYVMQKLRNARVIWWKYNYSHGFFCRRLNKEMPENNKEKWCRGRIVLPEHVSYYNQIHMIWV